MPTYTIPLSAVETAIINDIITYSNKDGSSKSSWYAGIASDPENRIFNDHNVDKDSGWWIYRYTESEASARKIESYLIERYGFDGASGGGDYTTKSVYAYKKTSSTIQ